MEHQPACAVCGKETIHKCSACGNAYYCSKQHQKEDWKRHAQSCRAFKLAESPTLGRYYVAARNIKVGEIVLKDDLPLVAGPMHNSLPVCLGCYTELHENNAVPCTKCGWPLCSNCKDHGTECDFTSSRRDDKVSITEFGYPHPTYQCINVIRALSLRNNNAESYKKLLSLESHCEKIKNRKNFIFEESENLVRFIKRFFKTDDIPDEEIMKIIGALQINGHEVPLTDPPYVAVYELASLLEHNCKANCSKSFTDRGGLIIHAATPVTKVLWKKRRDHISICYTDPLWGTVNRRHHLLETKYFECTCERCSDPTEFGVMFDAVKCNETNCLGYTLPRTFLGDQQQDYACTTCAAVVPCEKIEETLERIGIHLSKIEKNNISACERFLNCYKNVLHPNHFYNIDATIALAQLIGQQDGLQAVDENLLADKIELCKKLDNILKVLAPAENRIRGLILFEMHAALAEFSRRHTEDDTLILLLESKKCLISAHELLRYEPEVLPEGKIAVKAKENLQQINDILQRFKITSTYST
ncbi:SET domain-containing protein SmydA-8-like isoform X2 [Osmia bicornis bicornis]|uniref:SET domain-containing protein SmydA-8-like isoform X2 n=1 Tax=Osmia bicornis bicornis TaxID=1437191 RepID=UPI0010F7854B|nr:SET domain-containing protein SmydA-8-like isoform X2 [Osmia bicornis bicornis]